MRINFIRHKSKTWQTYSTGIFYVSAAMFVTLFAVEYLVPGFATSWFNPVWFLIIALISGTLSTMED